MKKLLTVVVASVLTWLPAPQPAQAEWNYRTLTFMSDALDVFWGSFLTEWGIKYHYPVVYPQRDGEKTPCGRLTFAQYCQTSNTIHISINQMNKMVFNIGDSAAYFVLAHEYGHSVQRHLGLLNRRVPKRNLELQADCLAGVFFAATHSVGIMEPGDLEEGLFTALISGDHDVWDADHHGTPQQRMKAFAMGFKNPKACF